MSANAEKFGEVLQRILDSRGMKSVDLAKKINKGQGNIDNALRGKGYPGTDTLLTWLEALDIRASEFFKLLEENGEEKTGRPSPVPGYDDLYDMLTTILSSGNPRRILGITINLEHISSAARAEMGSQSGTTAHTLKPSEGGGPARRKKRRIG